MTIKQHTLKGEYHFEGKGLHTGRYSRMSVKGAPAGSGICFIRTDIGPDAVIPALADRVSDTSRSTRITQGQATVGTIEHIMSALTGLGVDNAVIEIDGPEVPILDGSALPYVEAFSKDSIPAQEAERKWLEIKHEVEVTDPVSGGYIRVTPADTLSINSRIDFSSPVIGVQEASWRPGEDYAGEIAPCRTFVFLHEITFLLREGLVKGGDASNALVIVDSTPSPGELEQLAAFLGKDTISVTPGGYLEHQTLRFPNEAGRHKLLDLIGDIRLSGGYPLVKVEAYKPGHALNTRAAAAILKSIKR